MTSTPTVLIVKCEREIQCSIPKYNLLVALSQLKCTGYEAVDWVKMAQDFTHGETFMDT